MAPSPCEAISSESRVSARPDPVSTSLANAGSIVRIGIVRNVLIVTSTVSVSSTRLSRT